MKGLTNGQRYCKVCGTKLQKNGIECGKQRWRCPDCKTARVLPRQDVSSRNSEQTHQHYLLGKQTAKEVAKSAGISLSTLARRRNTTRYGKDSFYRRPTITGEVYPYIAIDATGLNVEIVAIVRDKLYTRNWRFAPYESSLVWTETLSELPRPGGIICDGQKGILKAVSTLWGDDMVIQRCHFHVKQNMRAKLTNHPESAAGIDLKRLINCLPATKNELQMAIFIGIFYALYDVYENFLNEKTYSHHILNSFGSLTKRRWFYTHRRVRSAYRQISNLIEQDQLFAYITHPELGLPATNNLLEGGLNARLSELLRVHRGMPPERQRQLVSEYLFSRSEH